MVHVSKKRLVDTQLDSLIHQLTQVIGRLDDKTADIFLLEFLGKEEKEILAKRMAAIVLISEQRSLYSIAKQLHMSQSTVGILYERYLRGDFKTTLGSIRQNQKNYRAFLQIIDNILTVGGIMPHRAGPDRRKRRLA